MSRATALLEVLAVTVIAYLTRAALQRFGAGFASAAVATTVVALAVATCCSEDGARVGATSGAGVRRSCERLQYGPLACFWQTCCSSHR